MSSFLSTDQIAHFEKVLESYQPDPIVSKEFRSSNFAVIAGPAAAGKDTLRNLLLDMPATRYISIVSTTSRPPRVGEIDDRAYHFTEASAMDQELQKGRFFEVALVHGQQLSALHVDEIHKLGPSNIGLSILVVKIEQQLREQKPDIRTIFLIPPSFSVMMDRLQNDRNFTGAELKRRLAAAQEEILYGIANQDYYCIVSDTKNKVRDLADSFLQTGTKDKNIDQMARKNAAPLLDELKSYLEGMI